MLSSFLQGCDSLWLRLFRWGVKVVRGAYLQYKRNRASSLSIPSPVQVVWEGGERCLPAVREEQSQLPLHSLSCSGGV
jgi:hypothetical protein